MRRLVVVSVLVWAAVWPLVHYALVQRYRLNPWKFGAWAMYTVPTPPVLVALFDKVEGGYRLIDPASLDVAADEARRRFEMDRHVWGDLATPDELAYAALAELPRVSTLAVIVQHTALDRDTGRMVSSRDEYTYERRGALAAAP